MANPLPRICLLTMLLLSPGVAASVSWVPPDLPAPPEAGPMLCPRDYLTPEQGAAVLQQALARFPDAAAWKSYRAHARQRIQAGAGLHPWPERTPLNPVMHSRRNYEGYSVENIRFEAMPGLFATGNLYRPNGDRGRRPAVLSTHGHTGGVQAPADYERHGRFHPFAQTRAAMLARQGAVVLTLDMFGYGDSIEQVGQEAHRTPLAMTVQLWNAIRAIDYLSARDDVDPERIAVTGESGGGTQAFLLTALDERVAVSVPVVMVSSYFFGGCPCESGRPIHRSSDHFVSNAMIAGFAVPRPLLVISDGKDWTQHVPQAEYPFLQEIYRRFDVPDRVENVHLADEGHDYGPSKRTAMYAFLAKHLGLQPVPTDPETGQADESAVTIEPSARMRVFDAAHPLPDQALRSLAEIEQLWPGLRRSGSPH